jgi:hypothetical protein
MNERAMNGKTGRAVSRRRPTSIASSMAHLQGSESGKIAVPAGGGLRAEEHQEDEVGNAQVEAQRVAEGWEDQEQVI